MLKPIKNEYQNSSCCVKAENQFSNFFPLELGVKQGCTLSPLLFNSLNEANTTPIHLLDQLISCLLYADDLVLLSETDKGLQESLDALGTYCKTWGLEINIDKSKVMVFNKAGRVLDSQYSLVSATPRKWVVETFVLAGIFLHTRLFFSTTATCP
jgi:hypothetical protein